MGTNNSQRLIRFTNKSGGIWAKSTKQENKLVHGNNFDFEPTENIHSHWSELYAAFIVFVSLHEYWKFVQPTCIIRITFYYNKKEIVSIIFNVKDIEERYDKYYTMSEHEVIITLKKKSRKSILSYSTKWFFKHRVKSDL